MGGRTWALLVALAFSSGLLGCDQLGGKAKKESAAESDDEDDAKKKKKKKKKSEEDEEDEEEATATATATATAAPEPTATAEATAEPSAEPTAEPSAEASASAAPAEELGGVKRYPDEVTDTGRLGIGREIAARKEADTTSETVVILRPGNEVTREAKRGAFTLVSWPSKEGKKFGWIETAKAQKYTAPTTTTTPTSTPATKPTVAPRPEFGRPIFKRDAG